MIGLEVAHELYRQTNLVESSMAPVMGIEYHVDYEQGSSGVFVF